MRIGQKVGRETTTIQTEVTTPRARSDGAKRDMLRKTPNTTPHIPRGENGGDIAALTRQKTMMVSRHGGVITGGRSRESSAARSSRKAGQRAMVYEVEGATGPPSAATILLTGKKRRCSRRLGGPGRTARGNQPTRRRNDVRHAVNLKRKGGFVTNTIT